MTTMMTDAKWWHKLERYGFYTDATKYNIISCFDAYNFISLLTCTNISSFGWNESLMQYKGIKFLLKRRERQRKKPVNILCGNFYVREKKPHEILDA